MSKAYDVIVIGARCAGSPTAMLLARKGYRVLLVDRASFPSDTLSTHVVQPLGVAALERWGLLERLVATACPPIDTYAFDFGPVTLAGSPGTDAAPVAYCPRRTVLDKLLVDAAAEAGAEVRERFNVTEIVIEDGRVAGIKGHAKDGPDVVDRARVVVGADGRRSMLAEAVGAERYREKPALLCGYYTYWSDLEVGACFATYVRDRRGFATAPTHDGLTLVVAGWPAAELDANKHDVEGHYLRALDQAPELAERVRAAKREAPFAGTLVPNYFRKPYGPGWALVGDAGYNRDFITAQGIGDAFRDAERCAVALDETLGGARGFDDAMADYQRERDEHVLAMYEFTCGLATLEPPPPEMQQLFAAMSGRRDAMDDFARVNAGTISPAEFFAPENVAAIMGRAATARTRTSAAHAT
ncbi:MAG TPA: NAD(P)/FAD-dependent oxidoreductase [Gammaproteobacteria bacterium]|nr:NAD(P)/FAD-dependent oxidoreductase [Gammaproteobacteria bacterium]